MKKINICLISNEYPPETGFGGIGTYTYNLAHGLTNLGHKVTVISTGEDNSQTDDHGVKLIRLSGKVHKYKLGFKILNWFFPTSANLFFRSLKIVEYLNKNSDKFDVIEGADWGAELFLYSLFNKNSKLVVKLHTPYLVLEPFLNEGNKVKGLDRQILIWMEKILFSRAKFLTSASNELKTKVENIYHTKKPIFVIPNGVDTNTFKPKNMITQDQLLFVGRLEPNKGVEPLIKALIKVFKQDKKFKCLFIGRDTETAPDNSGSMKKYLLKIIGENNILKERIIFINQLERHDLINYYQTSYLGIFPSFWENCPYVVLESLSCGLPSIATNTGGFKEIITKECGDLFEIDNQDDLEQKILSLIKDKKRRYKMSKEARVRIQNNFEALKIAKLTLNQYEK